MDIAQEGVTSGSSYFVPGNGTLTEWSNNAFPTGSPQQLTFKVFRKIGDPRDYKQVAHDGPRTLTPGIINRIPISIPVQTGDLIGLNINSPANTNCTFGGVTGDSMISHQPGLADGQDALFVGPATARVNVSALFSYSNTVSVGKTTLNNKKGTATLNLTLPNPGDLSASGKGVKASSAGAQTSKAVGAGPAQLKIKAKGSQLRTLNSTGKVKLKVTLTYTPTGGDPGTRTVKVKLRKR